MKTESTKRARKSRRRGVRYWVVAVGTMGMLVAYTTGNSRAVTLVRTHGNGAIIQTPTQGQAIRFDIPSGTLDSALSAFQKACGLRVEIPNDAMRSLASPGVSGLYTPDQALRQILKGTGVSYSFTGPSAVTLEIQVEAQAVEIKDSAKPQLSSPK